MAVTAVRPDAPAEAPRPLEGVLFSLIYGVVVFGLLAVFTASFPNALKSSLDGLPGDRFHYLRLQAAYALVGFLVMLVISAIHPERIKSASPYLLLVALCLTGLTLTGSSIVRCSHGSCRWLQLGPIRIQPSEFAKLALIIYIAAKLAEGRLNSANFGRISLKIMTVTAVLCILLFLQKDLGMAMLILVIVLGMAYLGHLRGRWLAAVSVSSLGIAVFGILLEEYRRERIRAFFDPLKYRTDWGWQILTMKTTIARGGLLGVGPGKCPEKFSYLPEAHTDAIFCVIASEVGLIGALVLLALIGAIVVRIMQIANQSADRAGYFMASGVGTMLAAQALINIGVSAHMLPVTGLTLPFVSYGGSSLVTCLAAIGVVMSVHRHGPWRRGR